MTAPTKKATRDKILDVAEKLFAEHGFDAVSVRDITQKADVRLASINYHFGSKDRLVAEVVGRRAHVLGEERKAALNAIEFDGLPEDERIDSVLRALIIPMLRLRLTGGTGWKNYCRLVAQQATLRKSSKMTSKFFDERALDFVVALKKASPALSDRQAHYVFQYSIGAMLYVFTENGRLDALSKKAFKSSDLSDICNELIPFLKGGIVQMTAGASSV